MKEKLITWMKKSSPSMHYLRLIVGGYMAYLGGQVAVDFIKGTAGGAWLLIGSVFLMLCGAIIVLICLYAVIKKYYLEEQPKNNGDNDPEDE